MQASRDSGCLMIRPVVGDQQRVNFQAAMALLRPSPGHYIQVWVSFLVSAGMTTEGILRMKEIAPAEKRFALLGLAFLTSQAFTLAKTTRDRATAALPKAPVGAEFLRGTGAWSMQVWTSFAVALGSAFYGAWRIETSVANKAFLGLGQIFTLTSVLSLAKTLRDRVDVDTWQTQGEAQQENLLAVAYGTRANQVQVWVAFGLSIVATLGGLLVQPMAAERRGFLRMGLLFITASALHLAKAVRDCASPARAPGLPAMGLCVASLLVSTGTTFAGLVRMPLSADTKRFVALGMAFALSAAFNLAKLVRDGEELKRLTNRD